MKVAQTPNRNNDNTDELSILFFKGLQIEFLNYDVLVFMPLRIFLSPFYNLMSCLQWSDVIATRDRSFLLHLLGPIRPYMYGIQS